MALRERLSVTKDFLQIILMLMFIALASLGTIWIGLSVYANITENDNPYGVPDMPKVSKAQYIVLIETTGEMLLTPGYDIENSPNDSTMEIYTLHGFYQLENDKWQRIKTDFSMDEFFWGNITVTRRSNNE